VLLNAHPASEARAPPTARGDTARSARPGRGAGPRTSMTSCCSICATQARPVGTSPTVEGPPVRPRAVSLSASNSCFRDLRVPRLGG
jgi:hypothetical protein